MLDELKQQVCQANLALVKAGLVSWTFGNVSGIDRDGGLVVIKPSGVDYAELSPGDMVVVSLDSGQVVEGALRPSSDTPTHLELYRAWPGVGGVAHTHSLHATAWAQARRELPALGTTHADYFHGLVPCTRDLTGDEITNDYEANTGKVIVERFGQIDPMAVAAVLVAGHGPFTWGPDAMAAVRTAEVLEYLSRLGALTYAIDPQAPPLERAQLNKHYLRKHGEGAYYGQK
jgi:L-ribulose-5-phosphate 4-epimerase